MRIRRVRVNGFRGIQAADIKFDGCTVFVGPNGCGKSALVDAISLTLGRPKMVRPLTEHDFTGSTPTPASRIRVLVTLSGFSSQDPNDHATWFQMGRAVPKWLDTAGIEMTERTANSELCVTLGFAARFDHDDLDVETIRYFHDDDDVVDPFADDHVQVVPQRLIADIGYFVLPARRTWDAVASFNSDLFRRTVLNSAGIPASTILAQRDELRNPSQPVEAATEIRALVDALNAQLQRLMLHAPKFLLRVTTGDSEGVLQALLPHYSTAQGGPLPAHRHGTGLLALQTLLLLLEVGKARTRSGQSFVLAMEEPELHLAPGLEGRLVSEAIQLANQVVCTTHSPDVARLFSPCHTLVMSNVAGTASAIALLSSALPSTAPAWERRLYGQFRSQFVSALMSPFVLVPEGRLDTEWLTRIAHAGDREPSGVPPLSCIYGFARTEDAKVKETIERVSSLRSQVVALVDGDAEGDRYVSELAAMPRPPAAIVQWPSGWTIERVVQWIVEAAGTRGLSDLKSELAHGTFDTFDEFGALLLKKNDRSSGTYGFKEDQIAHETITGFIEREAGARTRAAQVCEALAAAATNTATSHLALQADSPRHFRFVP